MYLYNGLKREIFLGYFSLQPIVQVHKIKTHNFYEIKVDFLTTINYVSGT
jgi:hypothetical protein